MSSGSSEKKYKMAFTLSFVDEEQLSEIVKILHCLFDKTTKGYKGKDVSANAWNKVFF